jgi:hypothetical protein
MKPPTFTVQFLALAVVKPRLQHIVGRNWDMLCWKAITSLVRRSSSASVCAFSSAASKGSVSQAPAASHALGEPLASHEALQGGSI